MVPHGISAVILSSLQPPPDHQSMVANDGQRRSTVAVNDGQRWSTVAYHHETLSDHHRSMMVDRHSTVRSTVCLVATWHATWIHVDPRVTTLRHVVADVSEGIKPSCMARTGDH
nr:hypothetical protein [Tanacetum cinerariifolium]